MKFDGNLPQYYEVPREVINDAMTDADPEFVNALLDAQENIADFHNRQVEQGFINPKANGVILGQRIRGLERVGLYVPGGTAAYPSSVLMNAVPAKIAGVKELIMVLRHFKDRAHLTRIYLLLLLYVELTEFSLQVVHRLFPHSHMVLKQFRSVIKL